MFCPKCGKDVSEEDNFCRKCGFSMKVTQDSDGESAKQSRFKQTCEIGWMQADTDLKIFLTTFGLSSAKNKFIAKGLGLRGIETIAESPTFTCKHVPKEEGEALDAINTLIASLVRNGWNQSPIRGESGRFLDSKEIEASSRSF